MRTWDPAGPLPQGTVLLEASAGTGKTHAIAALATRYLAEGVVEADRLAVITFTRIASSELRSRVRERLRASREALAKTLGGARPSSLDPTDTFLVDGSETELQQRYMRLGRAIAGLDGASIMTIHEFCQAMLAELGVLADTDPQATLVEDAGLVVDQVVEDVYLRRYAASSAPLLDLATARELARDALQLPTSPLVPDQDRPEIAERLEFARAVRSEFADRKRQLGLYTFDDQLLRLQHALDVAGEAGRARLRRRCQVVLVDEFQDTDPVQWDILREAFDGHCPLVLIGDPKQAIYSFRGADVAAYRSAVAAAGEQFSLDRNYRADAPVVAGVNALFANVLLGDGITVPAVTASHETSRLLDGPAPVRLRCLAPENPLDAASARRAVNADLVGEVVSLLSGGVRLADDAGPRPVQPQDIAILVGTNARGREVAEALAKAGVAVAFSGSNSIFASRPATDWLALLRALEKPQRQTTRAAILTDFLGGDLAALAAADDARFTDWSSTLQEWARLLARSGVAALFAAISAQVPSSGPGFVERVLGRPFGERDLTDYRHLAELLHAQSMDGVRGQALVAWLAEAVGGGEATEDRTRRLETDRHAVQILTIHKAKGLQFPVVFVPQATDLFLPGKDEGRKLDFHDTSGVRVLDLGGARAQGRGARRAQHETEQAQDRLRGLYVAATRAESQLTLWWARTKANTAASPLHRLLFRDRRSLASPETAYPLDNPPGDGHPRDLPWLAAAGIAVQDCPPTAGLNLTAPAEAPRTLVEPVWRRSIDALWRRTSYSGLTEATHSRVPLPVVAGPGAEDEPADPAGDEVASGPPSPLAGLPSGTNFGSLVHDVLEHLDWYTPGDDEALRERLLVATTASLERYPLAGVAAAQLAEALLPSLQTSLGSLADGLALRDIPVADRLSELDFEFPLGTAASTTTLRDVAGLLRQWLPSGHLLADYPAHLEHPELAAQVLRGFLTGSIDSVLRVHSAQGPRFVVVDYKTNRIAPMGVDLQLGHYTQTAMAAEMNRNDYPLQAILYCVALHRFLAARLAGYDPAVHLGGVGYLFVRGMAGPGEREPSTGVFGWRPPAGLVTGLSDLLADRGAR